MAKITAFENGPYVITGTATYVDADGNTKKTPGKSFALCRCGNSKDKPFCDGTHRERGFKSTEIVLEVEPKAE